MYYCIESDNKNKVYKILDTSDRAVDVCTLDELRAFARNGLKISNDITKVNDITTLNSDLRNYGLKEITVDSNGWWLRNKRYSGDYLMTFLIRVTEDKFSLDFTFGNDVEYRIFGTSIVKLKKGKVSFLGMKCNLQGKGVTYSFCIGEAFILHFNFIERYGTISVRFDDDVHLQHLLSYKCDDVRNNFAYRIKEDAETYDMTNDPRAYDGTSPYYVPSID